MPIRPHPSQESELNLRYFVYLFRKLMISTSFPKLGGNEMPNVTATLKSEIVKLAHKELSSQVREMKKVSALNRRDIAALKQMVTKLQQQVGRGNRIVGEKATAYSDSEATTRVRFTANGLSSERKRLGLSADDYGKLVGVSGQSIYNWEGEVAHPRKNHVRRIVAVRGIGKKEARARLAKLH
jgi:DNA-binding transcriptional regulator YiaG